MNQNLNEEDYETIDEFDKEVMRRLTRIETKLVRFMHHFGVSADGTPINQQIKASHPAIFSTRKKGEF